MLGIPFLDDAISKWFKPQTFDDPVDRLNYFITSTLLTFFALMVSAKQYVGSPIQCWMPMEFKGGWEQYAEDYCFIKNTYFIPFEDQIPESLDDRVEAEVNYYQWVPIVLALQAIMFYIPNWIWKTLHQQSGIDLSTAVTDARGLRTMRSSDRGTETKRLATYVSECLELKEKRRSHRRVFVFRFGKGLGSYVSCLYLFVKLLYVINIFAQFTILNNFLSSDNYQVGTWYGFSAFQELWNGDIVSENSYASKIFPRVTMCDFKVRRLANIHRYTVQCVIMINMFNEKIYLFIWFWFVFVIISTIINFLYCLATIGIFNVRVRTVKSMLKHTGNESLDNEVIRRFVNDGLRPDGCLLLRFIEGHAGAIVAREISTALYREYLEHLSGKCGPGSHSTESTTPGLEDGFSESYDEAKMKTPLIAPPMSVMSYPGPPKPKGI
uniref:Innexin n=1 Tax=Steinernema glaseri TaxID=37863 RepID=A0A1I7ZUZ4_9BILA